MSKDKKAKKAKESRKAARQAPVEAASHPMTGIMNASVKAKTANGRAMVAKKQARVIASAYPYEIGSVREETVDYRKQSIMVLDLVAESFAVEKVTFFTWDGKPEYDLKQVRFFGDQQLLDFLRRNSDNRACYADVPVIELTSLIKEADDFRVALTELDLAARAGTLDEEDTVAADSAIRTMVDFLVECNATTRAEYERMVVEGMISFDVLDQHFRNKSRITFTNGSELEGAVITGVQYGQSWTGPFFEISVEQYTSNGKNFGKVGNEFRIGGFRGLVPLKDLPLQIASEEDIHALNVRGQKWQEMVHTPQYLNYEGKMGVGSGWFVSYLTANGRCMVDLSMHDQMVQSGSRRSNIDVDKTMTALPDDMVFTAPAYVKGFSLSKKKWGTFTLSGMSQIEFRDNAYDLLVLDPEVKAEVRALVENSEDMFTDIISGKGGGAIFLLHGTPGLGKTLTAESVAEILHRPLYSVSVGELGVTPGEVESSLQEILEMVTMWNAVLLLDEADIFLEARSKDDIIRNAMVGVFLRLLEYHNGVLFLTTNRVGNFDLAVLSRISVILKYPDFTDETRQKVWDNILSSAGITGIDTAYMAVNYDVNGRQIKNAIRIASSLASHAGVPVEQMMIEKCLDRMIAVIGDLGEIDATKVKGTPRLLLEDALEPAVVPKQKRG